MIIKEQRQPGFLSGAIADQKKAATLQTMNEQAPEFFSEVVPAAFRLDNDVTSVLVSQTIKHISDDYDPEFYPADSLGDYDGTEYEFELLTAKNKPHFDAIIKDIEREKKDRETLANSGSSVFATMAAGILSPTILLPGGAIAKGAKGVSVAKSALSVGAATAGAVAISETALQMSQRTRSAEESVVNVAGAAILGGIIGGAASSFSRPDFSNLATKLETDIKQGPTITERMEDLAAKDLSAAAVKSRELTSEELKIFGGGGKFASRAVRVVNPFNRLANTPFKSARDTFVRLLEIPVYLEANAQGKSAGIGFAAETEVKLFEAGLGQSMDTINKAYAQLKKAEKAMGAKPMTFKEFRERVSFANRRGDVDANELVTKAAQKTRTAVFDFVKKQAVELGMFPEDVSAKFADSYLTRMWHKGKMIANPTASKDMLRGWASKAVDKVVADIENKIKLVKPGADAGKEADLKKYLELIQEIQPYRNAVGEGYSEYVEDVVEEMYARLTGATVSDIPPWIAPVTRGPLKEKLLDIEDVVAEPFLENDIFEVMNYYTRTMGSQIALTRQFGSVDMSKQIQAIEDEFLQMQKTFKDGDPQIAKLEKAKREALRDITDMRDLMLGRFRRSGDPDSNLSQAMTVMRDIQYMSKMGGVLFSSFTDIASSTMKHGVNRAFGEALRRIKIPKELRQLSKQELNDLGFGLEAVLATRVSTLADIADPFARGSALTRFTGSMAQGFSRLTLINQWNDMMKNWAANVTQARVLKNLENFNSLDAKQKRYMAYLGMDEANAAGVLKMFKKHGEVRDGIYLSGVKNWEDQHAARLYKAALRKEADSIIITKGLGDVPTFGNTQAGGLILQFKSFIFASHQRMLMRGLQDADANVLMGALMMVGMGMIVAAIKKAEKDVSTELRGEKKKDSIEDWDTSKWIVEGLDRSGLFGLLWEANNIWEKSGGYGITQAIGKPPASRYASRNVAGAILGPSVGTIADLASVAGVASSPLTGRDVTKADIKSIRNTIPFQNLIGIKFLFDAVEGKVSEALVTK